MSRIGWVLTGLLCVLLAVGWFFLLFSPTSDDIEEVRAETDRILAEAAQTRARADQLRAVRDQAPEAESALTFGHTILPEDPSIPALYRQLQSAADDSGARLLSINSAAPVVTGVGDDDVASIGISVVIEGTYFQIVDVVRRIEDPTLTPRALRWDAASIDVAEDPPDLTVTLAGQVFAREITELPTIDDLPPDDVPDTDDEADDIGDDDPDDLDEVTP